MIEQLITNICQLLEINPPAISHDTSHFQSDTMLAQCDLSGQTIYIRQMDKPNPDYIFAILHELRHIWQIQFHYDEFISHYQTRNLLGMEEYNNQPAEVDANAFAASIMTDWFCLTPQFASFSDSTRKRIQDRANAIAKSMTQ